MKRLSAIKAPDGNEQVLKGLGLRDSEIGTAGREEAGGRVEREPREWRDDIHSVHVPGFRHDIGASWAKPSRLGQPWLCRSTALFHWIAMMGVDAELRHSPS